MSQDTILILVALVICAGLGVAVYRITRSMLRGGERTRRPQSHGEMVDVDCETNDHISMRGRSRSWDFDGDGDAGGGGD